MAKTKTLKKAKKSPKPSKKFEIGGMSFETYSPTRALANRSKMEIATAMAEALIDGDKEALQEILAGYIRARNIAAIAEKSDMRRASIYETIDTSKDPRISTVCDVTAAALSFDESPSKKEMTA